ncbi:hypothetical protein IW147_004847 [Coemansia sp. RSA 720]|nr:hypothetical protein IW147_004847 [Coemansia sp. RSA 720]
MDAKNKILVLGRPEINKVELVHSIMAGTNTPCVAGSDASAQIAWHIDTRYYTAQTEFWVDNTEPLSTPHTQLMLSDPAASSIPIDAPTHELHTALSPLVDAIVFAFDPRDSSSFTDVLPWARFAQDYEPSVLLCVAIGDKVSGMDGQKDEWFDWCVQMGWEWVDLTDMDESEYSVGRVRDALVANEWATMVPKTNSKSNSNVDPKPDSNVDPKPDDSNVDIQAEPTIDAPPEQRNEWDRFDKVAGTIDPRRVNELHRSLFTETAQNDMSGLMSQLHTLRNEIAQLDPETARMRAAELALALAKDT